MPDPGSDRWRHRRWGPPDGRPPRWWPDNEPWPPTDGAPWRRMRRRFMWRFVLFVLALLLVFALIVAFLVEVITGLLDGQPSFALSALLTILVLIAVLSGLRRLVRGTAAPVGDLIEGAGRIEAGEIGTQVPERGPSEVRSLARAFNAMSARLAANEEARRSLLADVSHELRTPLTVMQGNLEGMIDGLYPLDEEHLLPVLEETRVLGRLVEDLRTLSLSEAGALALHLEPVDLGALLGEIVASHQAMADDAGVRLHLEVGDLAPIPVDAARIRQVMANLVANALRFTPPGGRILLKASATDGGVAIRVSDTGRGMEPAEVEHAFDRFYRSAGSGGSGLGLSIARNLVEAHGGRIQLHSVPGEGTTLDVWLPPASE